MKKEVVFMAQPIEGITPNALWTTVGVLIALAGIAVIVTKLIVFYWAAKDRKKDNRITQGMGITDEIAEKVLAKLAPRLDKIETKLASDKERLDSHERRLNEQERSLQKISRDTEQIMNVLDGMLMHFISGNDIDHLRTVKGELDRYKSGR